MLEQDEGDWLPWDIDFPVKDGLPGQSRVEPMDWDIVVTAIDFVVLQAEQLLKSRVRDALPRRHGMPGCFVLRSRLSMALSISQPSVRCTPRGCGSKRSRRSPSRCAPARVMSRTI